MITPRLAAGFLAVALCAGSAAGCSRAQAKTAPELPPLDVPVPPPRIVEASDPDTTVVGTLVEEPARNTVRPPADVPPRVEPPKPEPAPADAPGRPASAVPNPDARGTSPTLQTTPASREPDEARRIQDLLSRANENLRRVDYNRLSAGARTQYNQARQFVKLAEESLADRNLVFALTCADKAATLAAQLAGR